MTCPLLRQHGARDHTAPWFYGPDDEKMLGDIIKLRAAMKPSVSAPWRNVPWHVVWTAHNPRGDDAVRLGAVADCSPDFAILLSPIPSS